MGSESQTSNAKGEPPAAFGRATMRIGRLCAPGNPEPQSLEQADRVGSAPTTAFNF
jgi:hypothetical protein